MIAVPAANVLRSSAFNDTTTSPRLDTSLSRLVARNYADASSRRPAPSRARAQRSDRRAAILGIFAAGAARRAGRQHRGARRPVHVAPARDLGHRAPTAAADRDLAPTAQRAHADARRI